MCLLMLLGQGEVKQPPAAFLLSLVVQGVSQVVTGHMVLLRAHTRSLLHVAQHTVCRRASLVCTEAHQFFTAVLHSCMCISFKKGFYLVVCLCRLMHPECMSSCLAVLL
mgnify:CR=1 FL=1